MHKVKIYIYIENNNDGALLKSNRYIKIQICIYINTNRKNDKAS